MGLSMSVSTTPLEMTEHVAPVSHTPVNVSSRTDDESRSPGPNGSDNPTGVVSSLALDSYCNVKHLALFPSSGLDNVGMSLQYPDP